MLKNFIGYIYTLRNYLMTAKGKHDVLDYLKALTLIVLTTLIVLEVLR